MDKQEETERKSLETVWNYLQMNQTIPSTGNNNNNNNSCFLDAIFVLCSNDLTVADRAVELWKDKVAKIIIFSGGRGTVTQDWEKSEAETFSEMAQNAGVPESAIITEPESSNTGENVKFTQRLLQRLQIQVHSLVIVQKPYMERRSYATFMKQWIGSENLNHVYVTSPRGYPTLESYLDHYSKKNHNHTIPKEEVIGLMLGDLQRIKEYPKLGFQIEQDMPAEVWQAWESLVQLGTYNKHLLRKL